MIQRTLTALYRLLGARRFVPAVMGCALLLRLAWVIWMNAAGMHQTSDAAWYMERAVSIAQGHGYAIDGVPTAYWPVGYPGFLAIIVGIAGAHPFAAMLVNVALQGCMLLLAYLIARRLFASERIARGALLLLAIHPNGIAYSSLLLSENLFLPLMLLATLLLMKEREGLYWGIAAGIVYGLASLVKPQALFLPVLTIAALWLTGRKEARLRSWWRPALVVNAMMILTVLPWTLRNHGLYGVHGIISTNDGINLLIGNNPGATGGYIIPTIDESMLQLMTVDADDYRKNMQERIMAIDYIEHHPFETAATLPRKLWHLYRADAEGFTLNMRGMGDPVRSMIVREEGKDEGPKDRIEYRLDESSPNAVALRALKIIAQIYWVILCAAVALGLILWWSGRLARHGIRAPWLPFSIILYFTAIPLVYFGDGRFHAPAIPWMAMIAAAGVGMSLTVYRGGPEWSSEPSR